MWLLPGFKTPRFLFFSNTIQGCSSILSFYIFIELVTILLLLFMFWVFGHKTCHFWFRSCLGNGNPLQYSCLENPMEGGAWKAAVHGVAEGRTRLSDFTFTFHFHALEKKMATHSSVLSWRIPGTGEPGGLPSMGSHRADTTEAT